MSHMPPVGQIPRLTELETFDLMVALYPEKYAEREDNGEDIWDEVMRDYEEIVMDDGDEDNPMKDLLARIVYLAPKLASPLSGDVNHVLGVDDKGLFTAAIKRPAYAK